MFLWDLWVSLENYSHLKMESQHGYGKWEVETGECLEAWELATLAHPMQNNKEILSQTKLSPDLHMHTFSHSHQN